ncbi:MAG: nitrous oxide reductase family maturation protein NosD [Candidatus Marinimicrobia bacterium]|nr:nitrous oxide reductase family maturation protein NosD [Candidatus Neomarinimicrobiota bacterium]
MKVIRYISIALIILTVVPGRDWPASSGANLQEIIDGMVDGDRLLIGPGKYSGAIVVDRQIEIIGEDYPFINGEKQLDAVLITADSVSVSGLEIQWSGTRLLEDESGIKIEGDFVTIENCRIINTLHGIYVKGGKQVTLRNNLIKGRVDLQTALRGNGIHIWYSRDNLLDGNEINFTRDGIYFSFVDETKVIGNYVHDVRYGLHYMYSDDNRFTGNRFEQNVAGAALMYSQRIHFNSNIFAHNRGYRAYGVLYQSCDFCTAYDNLIIDNTRGVFFSDSNFNELWNNDIVENDIAVQINANCEDNKIYSNNFLENLSGLVVDAKGFPNYWADEGLGNYWTNYRGYDLDDNQIGDYSHKLQNVFEYLEVDYPEVRLYLFSPAAQALEVAERTFPILLVTDKEDPFPQMWPVENENVPWTAYGNTTTRQASFPLAVFYLLLTGIPVALIRKFRK